MTVHFIGAGPGAPDLITVRGLNLLKKAQVVLYAGSLVPEDLVKQAKNAHTVINTATMTLDEIIEVIIKYHASGDIIVRLHSGDTSLYGAVNEQIYRLKKLDIDYDITPGVPAFAAAAAAMKKELTSPSLTQTIILTRTAVRASKMPPGEELCNLASTGAALAIHLSINNLAKVVKTLIPYYGADCPIVVGYRISWPDEKIIYGTLQDIKGKVKSAGITRTALIIISKSLNSDQSIDSLLYSKDHTHIFRPN
tara:strand:+ start:133 stop:888 length:756 start_codon:yes stop_codon:yes gene_type:complete